MDSYVGSDRRKTGQVFGTAKDTQLLRLLSAKANATRRLGAPKVGERQPLRTSGGGRGDRHVA